MLVSRRRPCRSISLTCLQPRRAPIRVRTRRLPAFVRLRARHRRAGDLMPSRFRCRHLAGEMRRRAPRRRPPRPIPGRAARPSPLRYIQSGRRWAVRPSCYLGFDAWGLLPLACPVRVACTGRHGAIRLFAIEMVGHGCIPDDRVVVRALRFVLKRVLPRSCRYFSQRHGADPGAVMVRDRGFGYVFYGDHAPVAVHPGIGSGGPGRFPWASGRHGPRTPSGPSRRGRGRC